MIRIELRQRSSRWRVVGIGALLLIAVAAFSGAIYSLDRAGVRWQDWLPSADPSSVDANPPPMPVQSAEPAPQQTAAATEVWPDANDAPGRAADLLSVLSSDLAVGQLVIDDTGAFTIDGYTKEGLEGSLAPLRALATDVRVTTWTAGAGPSQCRITGIVRGVTTRVEPSTRQQAATLLAEAEALAMRHGLQQVRSSAIRAEIPPAGGLRYRADLSAVGDLSATRAALRAILDHRVGILHAALSPVGEGQDGLPHRHRITLLLDTAVRDEGNP